MGGIGGIDINGDLINAITLTPLLIKFSNGAGFNGNNVFKYLAVPQCFEAPVCINTTSLFFIRNFFLFNSLSISEKVMYSLGFLYEKSRAIPSA